MQPERVDDNHSLLLSLAPGKEATKCIFLWLCLLYEVTKGGVVRRNGSYCQSIGSWENSWTEMVLLELFTSVIITFLLLGDTKEAWESVYDN